MITTIEIKKEYKCDLCHWTQISTDEMPTGWITVHGFEADDSRPSPTMHLCPSCTVRTYRAIIDNQSVRDLIKQTATDVLIDNDRIAQQLSQTIQKSKSPEEHEDTDSMWLRKYEENY